TGGGIPGLPVALGGPAEGSPAAFFAANEFRPENLAGSTARLFLGVSLECAQCHDHPFAKWTRDQFWEYAAFFTDLPQQPRPGQAAARTAPPPRGSIRVLGTDKVVSARFLHGTEPQWKGSAPRPPLGDWMRAPENPYFARAAVNRLWAYFYGTALVGQSETGGEEGPAAHAELLDDLARAFAAHNFDMKFLIRAI